MGQLNKYDMAYFAGFFDGEGCISIASQGQKYDGKIQKHYRLEVTVGNTNHWVIEQMRFQFGGWVYLDKGDGIKTHRPFWRWMIYSDQAKTFLMEILPYLKLKKPEAELAIRWQSERKKGQRKKDERENYNILAEAQRLLLSQMKREVRD